MGEEITAHVMAACVSVSLAPQRPTPLLAGLSGRVAGYDSNGRDSSGDGDRKGAILAEVLLHSLVVSFPHGSERVHVDLY